MLILGLGSNQGNRLNNLRNALNYLKQIDGLNVIRVSPVYKSDALLLENSPEDWDQFYLNICVSCTTTLSPIILSNELQNIEEKIGRNKERLRWSPRIIDIDILAWEGKTVDTKKLIIPHPELHNRPFALLPFLDLVYNWQEYILNQEKINIISNNIVNWNLENNFIPLNTCQIKHRIDIPKLMAIVNVTPDSFSDGGKNQYKEQALQNIIQLFKDGAEIIDLGQSLLGQELKLFPQK